MNPWLPMFTVRIAHQYFQDNAAQNLTLIPTPQTASLLRRFGIIQRSDGRAFTLSIEQKNLSLLWSEQQGPTEDGTLRFDLFSTDPESACYTDFADASLPAVFRPVNSSTAPTSTTSDIQLLASRDSQDQSWIDNFRRLPINKPARGLVFFGEIAIPINPASAAAMQDWINSIGQHYSLTLPARQTIWKYLVLGDWKDHSLTLIDSRKEVEFTVPSEERLPDGQAAIVMRSKVPIGLRERPTQRFQLHDEAFQPSKVLIPRLPAASPDRIYYEPSSSDAFAVSEIYINR